MKEMPTEKSSLMLVPSGGLANRMRAIASAWHLCQRTGARLQMAWFQGWGMHAAFSDLFEPLEGMREAGWWDYVVNDRPRRHNLWLPWVPQRLWYGSDSVIHELQVAGLRDGGFDFDAWLQDHRRYMSCYDEFGSFPDSCYARLFRPNEAVQALIDAYQQHFSDYTIGLHIRRTDSVESIRKSPTHLFLEAARRELAAHEDLTIFLATDSEDVKREMRDALGDRIVTADHEASRDTVQGIREGLADMYALAHTRKIYGSAGSSFSVMASRLGGTTLDILETPQS